MATNICTTSPVLGADSNPVASTLVTVQVSDSPGASPVMWRVMVLIWLSIQVWG